MIRFVIVAGPTALIVLGILAGGTYERYEVKDAVRAFARIDAGEPAARSISFLRGYHRHVVSRLCDTQFCHYQLLFTNAILSKLHLAPRAEVEIDLSLHQGRLNVAGLRYTSGVFNINSPIVWVQEDFCAPRSDISCDFFTLNPHGRGVAPNWNGIVEFGQLAPDEQKRAAWDLNLGCFTAIQGCKDISELLPAVWQTAAAGTVTSRFSNSYPQCQNCAKP